MPYEIQAKAIERRLDRGKIIFSFFKSLTTIATTCVPPFLSVVGTIPISKGVANAISAIGYFGYISNQIFDYVENDQLRKEVEQHRTTVSQLVSAFPNGDVTFSPTFSSDEQGYLLFDVDPARTFSMFGASGIVPHRYDISGPILTALQILLVTAALIISLIQEEKKPQASIANFLVLFPLIAGLLAAILDPIEKHLKKANLHRARDVYIDTIYAFYRPHPHGQPASQPVPAPSRITFRTKQSIEGMSQTFLFKETSGHDDSTLQLVNGQHPEQGVQVAPQRYRYFKAVDATGNPAPAAPNNLPQGMKILRTKDLKPHIPVPNFIVRMVDLTAQQQDLESQSSSSQSIIKKVSK